MSLSGNPEQTNASQAQSVKDSLLFAQLEPLCSCPYPFLPASFSCPCAHASSGEWLTLER